MHVLSRRGLQKIASCCSTTGASLLQRAPVTIVTRVRGRAGCKNTHLSQLASVLPSASSETPPRRIRRLRYARDRYPHQRSRPKPGSVGGIRSAAALGSVKTSRLGHSGRARPKASCQEHALRRAAGGGTAGSIKHCKQSRQTTTMAIVKKTGPTAKRFPFNINYNPELRYNWETGRFENDAAAYDPAPGDQCMYGLDRFWDERYLKNAEPFEWYHDYHALKGLLDNFLNKEDNICLIGCGTSEMAADMAADGYKSIMNLDISRICVDEMQTRYADISGPPVSLKKKKLKKGQRLTADDFPKIILGQDLGGVQWRQGNACDLEATFDNQIFDVVLDKALLDALYCAQKPQKQVRAYLQEMDRILKPSGLFFCDSYGLPETRLEKLENVDPEDEEHLAWFCEVLSLIHI